MNITFEQAIESYLKFIKIKRKPQSYRSINSRIKLYILPYFKGKLIDNLTTIDYLDWQNDIDIKNLKYSYKQSLHYAMVALLNFCMDFYNLRENVASKVGNFRNIYEHNSFDYWTLDEYNKFISKVDEKIYKELFEFLFFTGCRIGEVLALTFNDIVDNTVHINKTISKEFYNGKRVITLPKTKKSIREFLIDNLLKNEILDLREYYNTKYQDFNNNFFVFGGPKPLSNTTVERKKINIVK